MRTTLTRTFDSAEIDIDFDTIIDLREEQEGKYVLRFAAPGSKLAVVVVRGITEIQLRNLASEIIRKV